MHGGNRCRKRKKVVCKIADPPWQLKEQPVNFTNPDTNASSAIHIQKHQQSAHASIESCFLDTVEKLQMDARVPKETAFPGRSLHRLITAKLSSAGVGRPKHRQPRAIKLDRVSKAYEDTFMAAPGSSERACLNGDDCEGLLMARADIHTPDHYGFIVKEFIRPEECADPHTPNLCILCLRKQVSLRFYNICALDEPTSSIIQPHRNIVNEPGEYRGECCIYPSANRFQGITDPFVSHQRHRYSYTPAQKILQTNNVVYFLGQCPSQTILELGRDTSVLTLEEAQEALLRSNDPSTTFNLRRRVDSLLRKKTPSFNYTDLYDACTALPLCSFFFQRQYSKIPIVHILSKALPQRCQYRNMKEVCHGYCVGHASIFKWMLGCIQCSLLGYYPHSRANISVKLKRYLISGFERTTKSIWLAWMKRYGYLLFYIIKEYIVWIIRYDVALFETVSSVYNWTEFQESCVVAMDIVRCTMESNFSAGINIFNTVEANLVKINSFQLRHMYKIPKYSGKQTIQEAFKRTSCMYMPPTALRERVCRVVYRQYLSPLTPESEWLTYLGITSSGMRQWKQLLRTVRSHEFSMKHIIEIIGGIGANDVAILKLYVHEKAEERRIRVTNLPTHWYIAQYRSLQARHDRNDGIPPKSDIFYICTCCKKFKGFIDGNNSAHAWGREKMIYDYTSGKLYCSSKTAKRNNVDCFNTECMPISLLGKMVQCYEKCYILCPRCARPCIFDFSNHCGSQYACNACAAALQTRRVACVFCGTPAQRGDRWSTVVVAGEEETLCDTHYLRQFRHVKEWDSKGDLFRAIRSKRARMYG
jgi:hypothetical protein